MEYRPLITAEQELRLLSVLPGPDIEGAKSSALPNSEQNDLVQCTLEHFPLVQDQLSEYHLSREPELELDWTSEDFQHGKHINMSDDLSEPNAPQETPSIKGRFGWGDFVALSYTWGNPKDKKEIVINGTIVRVQANLEAALRVLRSKKPIRSGYRIWVDALCINQEDISERNREVGRMKLIYKVAASVVVWLGPEADDSNKAMDLILHLSNSCKSNTEKSFGLEIRRNMSYVAHGSWLALSRLLERAYWHRMWIIQELCLGGSDIPILCGEKVVLWKEFYAAVYTFGEQNIDIVFACIDRERKEAGLGPFGLNRNKIIHVNEEHEKQAGIAKAQYMCLLDLARRSDATDPRDKVYGILGLMDPAVSSLVNLDYSLSAEEVYTDFVQQYIQGSKSLEILEQCRLHQAPMPSWVPDWRKRDQYRLFSGSHSTYHAGGDSSPSNRFRDPRILEVDGIILDSVDGLGQAYFEYGQSSIQEHGLFQPDNATDVYGSKDIVKNALWRTLTGDRTPQGGHAPEYYAEILDLPKEEATSNPLPSRGARALRRFVTQNSSLLISGRRLDTYFTSSLNGFSERTVDAVERVWRFTRTQRLATMLSGRIGMIPNEAKKGDVLCIFLGSNVPVLLRPAMSPGDPFQLVGSCYVYGIMAGEAMQWAQNGEFKVESISIC